MNKIYFLTISTICALLCFVPTFAEEPESTCSESTCDEGSRNYCGIGKDITGEIPLIELPSHPGYTRHWGVAQYGRADWSQVIGIAKNVTLSEAFEIADSNPAVDYFFYVARNGMTLLDEYGNYRIFHAQDAVFFAGEPHWGAAPHMSDGYVKVK